MTNSTGYELKSTDPPLQVTLTQGKALWARCASAESATLEVLAIGD